MEALVPMAQEEVMAYSPPPAGATACQAAALSALEGLAALLGKAARWRRLREVAWRRALLEHGGAAVDSCGCCY